MPNPSPPPRSEPVIRQDLADISALLEMGRRLGEPEAEKLLPIAEELIEELDHAT